MTSGAGTVPARLCSSSCPLFATMNSGHAQLGLRGRQACGETEKHITQSFLRVADHLPMGLGALSSLDTQWWWVLSRGLLVITRVDMPVRRGVPPTTSARLTALATRVPSIIQLAPIHQLIGRSSRKKKRPRSPDKTMLAALLEAVASTELYCSSARW